jgi:hypothetical protein
MERNEARSRRVTGILSAKSDGLVLRRARGARGVSPVGQFKRAAKTAACATAETAVPRVRVDQRHENAYYGAPFSGVKLRGKDRCSTRASPGPKEALFKLWCKCRM